MIGLSGLITPSLEEMAHVAREMQRAGLQAAAADRRRDHLARAHRGEDRAELLRAGGLRARRLAQRAAWCRACCPTSSATPTSPRCAPTTSGSARSTRDKKGPGPLHAARATRAQQAMQTDWQRYAPPVPRQPGHHGAAATIRSAELVALHRLGAVLPDLGPGRPVSGDPRRPGGRRGGAQAVRRGQAMLDAIVARRWLTANGVIGAVIRRRR